MNDAKDTIVVTLKWEPMDIFSMLKKRLSRNRFGQGIVVSISCALAISFRQLFENGKPVGKINYIF